MFILGEWMGDSFSHREGWADEPCLAPGNSMLDFQEKLDQVEQQHPNLGNTWLAKNLVDK